MTREPRAVTLRAVRKCFGDVTAVADVTLEIHAGELMVLVGPSGCGKSTLLRLIAGLEEPDGGEVWIGDHPVADVEPRDRDVAMVFQSYALYPHMTVARNLGFGLSVRGAGRTEIEARVGEVAASLRLGELLGRRPGQLSGGQQQRVALGRAMVRDPGVFLFDEPLSNLDAALRLQTRDEIAALHRRLGTTMIFVTHDQVEALSLGQRVAVMDRGRVQQVGTPHEVYRRPANLFVAGFVGSPPINRLALTRDRRGRLAGGPFTFPGPSTHREATLGVRPEDLTAAPGSSAAPPGPVGAPPEFTAAVLRVESLGSEQRVHLDGPGEAGWVARAGPTLRVAAGMKVSVRVAWERTHLFAPDGRRLGRAPRPGGAPPS